MSTTALSMPVQLPVHRPAHLPAQLQPAAGFPPRRRPVHLLLVAAAHVALIWLLLQADGMVRLVHQVSPLMVALLSEPPPPHPPEPTLPRPKRPLQPPPLAVLPPPEVPVVQAAPPAPPPAAVVVAALPAQAPAVAQASTTPVAMAALPAVVAPAPTPVLPASAIRYRVPPAIDVPMASRRLGESGTVLLRVRVDAQGLPRQISVHRSSGHARLDEQAMAAMRQARFQPVTEAGSAIEWVVIAPLQYEID